MPTCSVASDLYMFTYMHVINGIKFQTDMQGAIKSYFEGSLHNEICNPLQVYNEDNIDSV